MVLWNLFVLKQDRQDFHASNSPILLNNGGHVVIHDAVPSVVSSMNTVF